MNNIKALWQKCRQSNLLFIPVVVRHFFFRLTGKSILSGSRVKIKGLKNITTEKLLTIGVDYVGFMHNKDITYLNVRGKLIFRHNYSIGTGCRFDIGRGATAEFGAGYVNAMTTFVIMHGITVGDGSVISWGCEFLDADFHQLTYPGKKEKPPQITIGNHVWIGSNVIVLKGSTIPDGCIVAAGSVVASVFEKPGCLIGGNPARVIKENVEWN